MKVNKIDNNSGIYTITNLINGKIYVGFCQDFKSRYNDHKCTLANNKHGNEYLQKAYNKYGKENFIFEVLEYCSKEYLASQEHYWATLLNVHNRNFGYNIQPTHPDNLKVHSEETKLKIRTNSKGIKKSEETRKRMSKGMKGKPKSAEHRKSLSEAKKGTKMHKNILEGLAIWRNNRSALKKKELNKTKTPKKLIIQMDLQNNFIKEWQSAVEAAKALNINIKHNHIHDCCKGIRKSSYNFKWKYSEELFT